MTGNPALITALRQAIVAWIAYLRQPAGTPLTDVQAGLLDLLGKRGTRLGGFTGQYLLRFLGWDAFVLSGHVLLCLRDAGVPLSATGTSKKDFRAAQAQLNAWKDESGLPMAWVSRICALSIGENYDVARLKEIMQL